MANALGVRFNATSTGTGDFVDASAVTGYRRGASILVDGATYRYRAENSSLSEYEWGTGVWTNSTSTLARTTIFASSTGAKVSFTSVPQVAITIFPDDVREVLTAARTYYVRSDGNDNNPGTVDSAGGAFLTIAKAMAVAGAIDCAAQQLTITINAATWTTPITLPRVLGSLTPILTGVGATTIISVTSADAITNDGGGVWQVNSLKVAAATSGSGMIAKNGGVIKFQSVEFGACQAYQALVYSGSTIQATGNFSVSGGGFAGFAALSNGLMSIFGRTITYSNSPVYSGANFYTIAGYIDCYGMTFTNGGTVTGPRYDVSLNGVIFTNGGGASYVPGNSAGVSATGGQYG